MYWTFNWYYLLSRHKQHSGHCALFSNMAYVYPVIDKLSEADNNKDVYSIAKSLLLG